MRRHPRHHVARFSFHVDWFDVVLVVAGDEFFHADDLVWIVVRAAVYLAVFAKGYDGRMGVPWLLLREVSGIRWPLRVRGRTVMFHHILPGSTRLTVDEVPFV